VSVRLFLQIIFSSSPSSSKSRNSNREVQIVRTSDSPVEVKEEEEEEATRAFNSAHSISVAAATDIGETVEPGGNIGGTSMIMDVLETLLLSSSAASADSPVFSSAAAAIGAMSTSTSTCFGSGVGGGADGRGGRNESGIMRRKDSLLSETASTGRRRQIRTLPPEAEVDDCGSGEGECGGEQLHFSNISTPSPIDEEASDGNGILKGTTSGRIKSREITTLDQTPNLEENEMDREDDYKKDDSSSAGTLNTPTGCSNAPIEFKFFVSQAKTRKEEDENSDLGTYSYTPWGNRDLNEN
jgi:hypothetical protein